ncbi:hypothetical protein CHH27_01840 [Labrenzia sp. VG12]|nr:hypothetical protein CHH27_01840 [Labrenzia sp. VG12]
MRSQGVTIVTKYTSVRATKGNNRDLSMDRACGPTCFQLFFARRVRRISPAHSVGFSFEAIHNHKAPRPKRSEEPGLLTAPLAEAEDFQFPAGALPK